MTALRPCVQRLAILALVAFGFAALAPLAPLASGAPLAPSVPVAPIASPVQISLPPKSKSDGKGNVAPYLVCTVCGERNYTSARGGGRDKDGNEIAWCTKCKRDTGQRSGQGGSEEKKNSKGGNLHLPPQPTDGAGTGAAPSTAPGAQAGTKPPAPGDNPPADDPTARTSGAAGFIFGELRKAQGIDDHLALKAVDSLIALGDPGLAAARASLYDTEPVVLMTAARVLMRSGNGDDVELVKNRVRGKLPPSVGTALVDELVRCDPVRVTPRYLCELIDAPHAGVRLGAERNLRTHLSPDLLPLLEPSLASKRAETRLAALTLIAEINDPSVTDLLLAHVADASSNVASSAVSALAARKDPELDAKLLALAFKGRWMLRENSYVLITIVEREDVHLKPILDESVVEPLLNGLQSNDPFVAGACATALAGIGFRSTHSKATTWLDQSVMDRLVFTVSGKEFHNDFTALANPALRRLRLISGQEFGKDGPRWVEWWLTAREGFFARRACIEVEPADVAHISVRYQSRGEDAVAFALLGPAVVGSSDSNRLSGEVFYLTRAEALDLLAVLEREGLFGPDKLPGVRGARGPGERTLEVAVAGRGKAFTFGPNSSETWFERAAGAARALRDKNSWQRYPDPRKHASSLALWQEQAEWWSAEHTARERALRMKALILGVLPTAKASVRDSGVEELARLYREEHVAEAADFSQLTKLISDEPAYTERTHKLVVLALDAARAVESTLAPRGTLPAATSPAASAATSPAAPAATSTAELAAKTESTPVAKAGNTEVAKSESAPAATSAASDALPPSDGDVPGAEKPALTAVPSELGHDLVNLLHQKFHEHAAVDLTEIARACGSQFSRELARDERPLLRAVAAASLSALGTSENAGSATPQVNARDLAVLMKLLDDKDRDVEVAAILALGDHHVEAARTELLVRSRLGLTPVRVAALQAIGKMGGDLVLDALVVGASDPDIQVRVAAAKGLAALADPASTQILISMLAEGKDAAVFEPVRLGLARLGKAAWPDLLRVAHSPGNHARREATILISEQGLPEAASSLMTMLTTTPNDPELARELAVLTCVDFRGQADPATAWWTWWDGVVHDDSLAWFLGALERAGLSPPGRDAFEGAGTSQGRSFLVAVMGRQEGHLVERSRRELSRMLGRDLGEIPPRGAVRDAWLLTLRESLQHKRAQ